MYETQIFFGIVIGLLGLGGFIPLAAAVFQPRSDRRMDESQKRATSSRQEDATEKQKLGFPTTFSLVLALLGSGVITFYALKILIGGGVAQAALFATEPRIYNLPTLALTIYVDRLAAFFLLLLGGLSIGIVIYSFEYLLGKADRTLIAGGYNLFVLSEVLFVVANNVFFFVVLLECATLTCGFLMLHKHHEQPSNPEHRQSVKTYLIANHIGGVLILAALLILAIFHNPATLDMSMFRQMPNTISPIADNFVFLLAFIGFGIKAGIVPFHIWVAIAHPSLPTNVHAISVGIMIKIALYGMIRIFFQFFSAPPWWWGFTVLLVAAFTALIGVRNALYGRTLKDSLADHSVENIGIILASIGLALLFASYPKSSVIHSLTGLALVAGLYHLLNHTVFKGLLYLCTGAIDYLTRGVVELKRLGGLIHRYPWTSACFLVGSVAIAGFPPFNGFISEWLTLQALIAGANLLSQDWLLLAGIVLSILLLVSAFALTAFAFVKIAGEVLLGKPRDETILATSAKDEVPWRMRGILVVLAVLCLLLGIMPGLVIFTLGTIVSDLGFPLTSPGTFSLWGGISLKVVQHNQVYTANLLTVVLITLLGLVVFVVLIALRSSQRRRTKAVWTGGTRFNPSIMQYTSSTYTSPVRDFLGKALSSVRFTPFVQSSIIKQSSRLQARQPALSEKSQKQYIKTHFELSEGRSVMEPFREAYNWLINLLQRSARSIGSIVQNGDLRNYLLYIFVFFITVFIVFIFLTGVNR
jgi:hydrogenase-4 component B